jgi:hypothetical protein
MHRIAGATIRVAGFSKFILLFGQLISHERTSMNYDAGLRVSRLAEQKQRARRMRIGVMLVLCALPVAMAFAKPLVTTLARVSAL